MRHPLRRLGLLALLLASGTARATPGDDRAAVLEMEGRFVEVIARVRPAVVSITASFVPSPPPAAPDEPPRTRLDPVLPPIPEPRTLDPGPRMGSGSGVLISPDGLVLTNHHVAGWATALLVQLADGSKHRAELVGTDPRGDLALVRIEGHDLPFATLGPDDRPAPGSWVVAMGNPFTLASEDGAPVVAQGIVSGLHRIQSGDQQGDLFYGDALQTDAEINPGNSGGPLFDLEGRLVGINGRIATRDMLYRINTGVGFAVSARQIRRMLPNLKAGGTARHGFLGIRYDVDEMERAGVEVRFVYPGSPAAEAGLRSGDRIVALDGDPVPNGARLAGLLSTYPEGGRLRVRFMRDGEEHEADVTLARRPGRISR